MKFDLNEIIKSEYPKLMQGEDDYGDIVIFVFVGDDRGFAVSDNDQYKVGDKKLSQLGLEDFHGSITIHSD